MRRSGYEYFSVITVKFKYNYSKEKESRIAPKGSDAWKLIEKYKKLAKRKIEILMNEDWDNDEYWRLKKMRERIYESALRVEELGRDFKYMRIYWENDEDIPIFMDEGILFGKIPFYVVVWWGDYDHYSIFKARKLDDWMDEWAFPKEEVG